MIKYWESCTLWFSTICNGGWLVYHIEARLLKSNLVYEYNYNGVKCNLRKVNFLNETHDVNETHHVNETME